MFKGKQNLRTTALNFSTSANCSLNVYFLRSTTTNVLKFIDSGKKYRIPTS